jgi:hypothetical protein
MMDSANTGPELRQWLRWAFESGKVPVFVRTVADAACLACLPDFEALRPVLVELKRRYPEPEPGKPPVTQRGIMRLGNPVAVLP